MSIDVYVVGATVPLTFDVVDRDGDPVNATTASLTVTREGAPGEAVALSNPSTGRYEADFTNTGTPGWYVARLVLAGAVAGAVEDSFAIVATPTQVTVPMLRAYLGDVSDDDDTLAEALLAERFAQARRCRIEPYTPDLLEALKRRVARNLAARKVPVATFVQFDGGGQTTRVPAVDHEVKRLEAGYRRNPIG